MTGAPRTVQVPRPRLAEMIAAELRTRILSGEYGDGDFLPKQDDLIETFGVSPPSIREALRVLETEGLVTVQRGNVGGAVVHAPQASKVAYMLGLVLEHQQTPISDIVATLQRLDPACAAACAERSDRRRTVVPQLRANVKECRSALDDPNRYAPLARHFHEIMVAGCGSPTLSLVVGSLESLWTGHVVKLAGGVQGKTVRSTTTQARQASLAEHERLLELISAGDAEGAAGLAHEHLTSHDDLAYPFSLDTRVAAETVRDRRD
jgi:GntR family transcriptional regulator, transcriptional repressor for pyruvate dehydrogenase complex